MNALCIQFALTSLPNVLIVLHKKDGKAHTFVLHCPCQSDILKIPIKSHCFIHIHQIIYLSRFQMKYPALHVLPAVSASQLSMNPSLSQAFSPLSVAPSLQLQYVETVYDSFESVTQELKRISLKKIMKLQGIECSWRMPIQWYELYGEFLDGLSMKRVVDLGTYLHVDKKMTPTELLEDWQKVRTS